MEKYEVVQILTASSFLKVVEAAAAGGEPFFCKMLQDKVKSCTVITMNNK